MKFKVFTAYDSKAEAFNTPFFMPKSGQAIRAFAEQVNKEGTDFNKFPADFTLFELGEYDDDTGLLTPLSTPKSLGLAMEFLENA